jgi:hypothetical protein
MTEDTWTPAAALGTAAAGLDMMTGKRGREATAIARQARAECAARRTRVLRYPDLVAAMARPPLKLDAHRWNGYVPPSTCQEQIPEVLHSGGPLGKGYANRSAAMTGPTELNTAAHREAFVAICAEAYRRDVEAGLIVPRPSGASGPDPDRAPDAAAPAPGPAGPAGQGTLGDWPAGSAGQAANGHRL